METKALQPQPLAPVDTNQDTEEIIIEDRSHGKRYLRGKLLGKGGFAKCYEMKDLSNGVMYAGKFVLKSSLVKPKTREKLTNEIKIHRSTNHPNIVKFHQCFEDREYVYIILELCENKSFMELMKKRRRLTESETQYYMLQLLSALHYLHRSNIIHRDLKLGNFFINEKMEMKIGDFGLAAQLLHPEERKTTICGTPNYIAPEMLDGRGEHGYEVDIWSVGVILYTLLVGRPPFETSDVKTTYRRIRAVTYDFPEGQTISEHSKSLIRMILCADPAQRPSLKDIANHSFFKSGYIPRSIPITALIVAPTFHVNQIIPTSQSAAALFPRSTAPSDYVDKENQPAVINSRNGSDTPQFLASLPQPTPNIALSSHSSDSSNEGNSHPILQQLKQSMQGTATTGTSPKATESAANQLRLFVRVNSYLQQSGDNDSPTIGSGSGVPTPSSAAAYDRTNTPSSSAATTMMTTTKGPSAGKDKDAGLPQALLQTQQYGHIAEKPRMDSNQMDYVHKDATNRFERKSRPMPDPYHQHNGDALPTRSNPLNMEERGAEWTKAKQVASSGAAKQNQATLPAASHEPQVKDAFVALTVSDEAAQLADNAQDLDDDDRGNLTHIHRHLTMSFAHATSPEKDSKGREKDLGIVLNQMQTDRSGTVMWLTKWVDYSNKYGLGYQLSDGTIGVFFNDYTKIILATDSETFMYVPYKRGTSTEEREIHTMSTFPPTLQKKVTLLKYFKNYLTETGAPVPMTADVDARNFDPRSMIYVKKWLRTKNAIIFRLSNRNVQVNFFDHTKLILSSETQVVTYVNKKRELSTHSLSSVMKQSNPELVSRLKYTKDVLFHLISRK